MHMACFTTTRGMPFNKDTFEKGWEKPSPIQEASISIALSGRDIMARDKNKTGKKGAYCIPCSEQIVVTKDIFQDMIIVPNREQALQTSQITIEVSSHLDIKVMVTADGTDLKDNIRWIYVKGHLVVATTGRILKLMGKQVANVSKCEVLELEEADKRLTQDFKGRL